MKFYIFVDLDDTIFQTKRKCLGNDDLTLATLGKDGLPLSFMTSKQRALFSMFDKHTDIIPVTARNYESFTRVNINFKNFIILNFGAIILKPGRDLDILWFDKIKMEISNIKDELFNIKEDIKDYIESNNIQAYVRIVEDFGIPLYILIKSTRKDDNDVKIVWNYAVDNIKADTFYIHLNDNNFAIVPLILNKLNAVQYVINNISKKEEPFLTVGMGDSLTDLNFMRICDYMVIPNNSQIWQNLEHASL